MDECLKILLLQVLIEMDAFVVLKNDKSVSFF